MSLFTFSNVRIKFKLFINTKQKYRKHQKLVYYAIKSFEMSAINTSITKQPFKLIEIPLNKFHDEAIPHHRTVFETHKTTVKKFINSNNTEQLNREVKDKKRTIRQLRDLMYELDTLRTQVQDSDLDKFDSQTLSLRKTILELISKYASLEAEATKFIENHIQESTNDTNQNPVHGAAQLQIQDDLSKLKQGEDQERLQKIETLNRDIEDVHGIFVNLNEMVVQQSDSVNTVETNVDAANENVKGGLLQLIRASKLKKASYPLAGAFIGTVIGGPIGSVAGLKIGGLAAIGCGLAGYISGRFIKKVNDEEISNTEVESDLSNVGDSDSKMTAVVTEKKDI